jgi:hypothetical protein
MHFYCSAEITFDAGESESIACNQTHSNSGDEIAIEMDGCEPPIIRGEGATSETIAIGDTSCIICWERQIDAILLECGHSGLCVECATVLWDQARLCPLCRRGFTAVMRIVARKARVVCISCLISGGRLAPHGALRLETT